jgi:hypothetical protein
MKEKLKNHFLNFGPQRFVIFTVLSLFATDILNCYYLKLYWLKKDVSLMMVYQSVTQTGALVEDFNPDTISEMVGFVNNTFYFLLLIILVNNAFFYLFYFKKRLWAQGYVLFYTLTAALFSVSFVIDNVGLGAGWMAYNILSLPFYLYLFFGVKLLKLETTIPAREKKAL